MARGLNEPGSRMLGYAAGGPLLHRDGERFLRDFLGQVEVTGQPDQCGYDPTPVRAIHGFNGSAGIHMGIVSNQTRLVRFTCERNTSMQYLLLTYLDEDKWLALSDDQQREEM